eukprot:758880_1
MSTGNAFQPPQGTQLLEHIQHAARQTSTSKSTSNIQHFQPHDFTQYPDAPTLPQLEQDSQEDLFTTNSTNTNTNNTITNNIDTESETTTNTNTIPNQPSNTNTNNPNNSNHKKKIIIQTQMMIQMLF